MLQVEDSGPGVARGRARTGLSSPLPALGSEADGSGLGPPIVMEIAAKHHAEVLLEDAHPSQNRQGRASVCGFGGDAEEAG